MNLPGVNTTGNQNTTGNAATATKLATARNINGVKFDGSADISIPTITSRGRVTALTGTTQGAATGLQMYEAYNNGYPSAYGNVLHLKGATAVGEGELFIGWSGTSGAHAPVHVRSRRDTDTASWSEWAQVYTSKDSIPGVNTTGNQNTTGNAASATKLQTARTIGGVSFNGTANIDLPGVNKTGNQNTTGNAATATKLQTARTINGVSFDGSKNIELTPRSIGTINSTTMSFSGGAGWFRLATVTMPQASSVVYISLVGGAGYNVGSPQQAGISELVLRAGNGNPKGITGALWRRTSVGFTNFAWVNTSGDTYDVYVEIGNYATGVNIQWDYTKDATVQIHTSPTYTANKPTGLTDGTVYVIYSSHIKPTATDVGALPTTGGTLTGGLTAAGEIISKSANGLRIAYGNYGFFIRNDGSSTYFMLTNSGDSLGTWNSLRPLTINNANGAVSIGNGLTVNGSVGLGTANALGGNSIVLGDNDTGFKQNGDGILDVYANSQRVFRFQNDAAFSLKKLLVGDSKTFSLSSSNTSTKNVTFNLWGASTRPVVAELGDDSGWHFYSQRNTDNSITFAVNGQVSPSNYSNFDSRYALKTACVTSVRLGAYKTHTMQKGTMFETAGYVITGLGIIGEVDGDDPARLRPLQYCINGTWYTAATA
ncbi:phage tail protein [Salmonella enterica]|nr:phage tail protein [Salmonella enterica]